MKKIYLYLIESIADWEYGYLLHGLMLQKMLPTIKYELCTIGMTNKPIITAGGITMVPDISLDEFTEVDAAALLLIGADSWFNNGHKKILDIASRLLDRGVIVAAICGATVALSSIRVLNNRNHTSNSLPFLKELSLNYKGAKYYKEVMASKDGNLITASSAGSLLWAYYILQSLHIYSEDTLHAWYNYFLSGDAKYYDELMKTLMR